MMTQKRKRYDRQFKIATAAPIVEYSIYLRKRENVSSK